MVSNIVDIALDAAGFGRFQLRALLLCSAGYFASCSELLLLVFLEAPVMAEFGLSARDYVLLPFGGSLLTFFASLVFGRVADRYGRRLVFTWSLLLVGGAGLLCACARSFAELVALRWLVSIGNSGIAVVDYIVYQEFSPRSSRGRHQYIVFVAGCLGVLYLALFAAFVPSLSWRALVVLAAVPVLPAGLLRAWFAWETPHNLVARGHFEEAYAVLVQIAEENGTKHHLPSQQDFLIGSASQRAEQTNIDTLVAVLKHRPKQLLAPLSLIWLMQSTAYWGLTLFLPVYFQAVGVPANKTIFAMVFCELPGCALSAWLVEHPRVGRVRMLCLNFAVASLAAFAMGTIGHGSAWTLAPLACLVYFSMIPNWGMLFMYTPESYPSELRASAVGFFQTLQGLPSIVSPFLSAALVMQGEVYMLVWAACLAMAFAASLALPSHRGDGLLGAQMSQ